MRHTIRHALTALTVAAAVAAPLAATAPTAQAATYRSWTAGTVTFQHCKGVLSAHSDYNGHAYASGTLVGTSYLCLGWLERSHLGGAFTRVSGVHNDNAGYSSSTNWYLDTAGYRARMCVQPAYHGAPVSCTGAW